MQAFSRCSALRPRVPWAAAICVLLTTTSIECRASALSFDDAIRLGMREAPAIVATRLNIAAAETAAVSAGELPDPQLALGLDNLPVEGSDRFTVGGDFMTMRRLAISQTVTSSARRAAARASARGEIANARAEAQRMKRAVLQQIADAWIMRLGVERQLAIVGASEQENRLLAAAMRARYAAAQGSAADLLLAREEALSIADRTDLLTSQRTQATAQLRRWLGAEADRPLTGELPDWTRDVAVLRSRVHRHAELLVLDARAGVLDAAIDGARAAQHPDWGIEVAYQQRGSRFSDMVSLQVSMDLPLFGARRQRPQIDARIAERSALDAEREAALREHAALLETELAELARLDRACIRQRELALPLARERSGLARVAWQNNSGTLAALIAARQASVSVELESIALQTERARLAASLQFAFADIEEAQ